MAKGDLLCNSDGNLWYLGSTFAAPTLSGGTWVWQGRYPLGALGSLMARGDLPGEVWAYGLDTSAGRFLNGGYIAKSKSYNLSGVSPLTEANIRAHVISELRSEDTIGAGWAGSFLYPQTSFDYSGATPSSCSVYFRAYAHYYTQRSSLIWRSFKGYKVSQVMVTTAKGGNLDPSPTMPLRVGFMMLSDDWDTAKSSLPTTISGLEALPGVNVTSGGTHFLDVSGLNLTIEDSKELWLVEWCANIMPPGKGSGANDRFEIVGLVNDWAILLDN